MPTYHGLIPEGYTIQVIRDENAWMDAPVESDKWRNLYFLKDGLSLIGNDIHSSERIAKDEALKWIDGLDPTHLYHWSGVYYYKKDLSHTIQMPVKE